MDGLTDSIREADAEHARRMLAFAVEALDCAACLVPWEHRDWYIGAANVIADAADSLRDSAIDDLRRRFDAIVAQWDDGGTPAR